MNWDNPKQTSRAYTIMDEYEVELSRRNKIPLNHALMHSKYQNTFSASNCKVGRAIKREEWHTTSTSLPTIEEHNPNSSVMPKENGARKSENSEIRKSENPDFRISGSSDPIAMDGSTISQDYPYTGFVVSTPSTDKPDKGSLTDDHEGLSAIPSEVYGQLPNFFKNACQQIEGREKDIALLSVLTLAGTATRGITGSYFSDTVHTNLYCMIIASAASGKSNMRIAEKIGSILDDAVTKGDNALLTTQQTAGLNEHPCLFIPPSVSKVAMIKHLKASLEYGLIMATEIDSLASAMNQQWGDFSDTLRCGFHNEPLKHSSVNDKYSNVKTPKLSVLLSGTPGQVKGIIPNAENGLFSRCMYYIINQIPKWKNPFEHKTFDFDNHYKQLGETLLNLTIWSIKNPVKFSLSKDMEKRFNEQNQRRLDWTIKEYGNGAESIVKRLANIQFRLMMILSNFRLYESNIVRAEHECDEVDFTIASRITNVLLEHALFMYKSMPKQDGSPFNSGSKKNSRLDELLSKIPRKFKKRGLLEKLQLTIPNSTFSDWLNKLESEGRIRKCSNEYGYYEKI